MQLIFRRTADHPCPRALAKVRRGRIYVGNRALEVASLRRSALHRVILLPRATAQIARMLDAMPGAALLLDSQGRILRANAGAETLLREGDGILARQSGGLVLAARLRIERRRLSTAIDGALAVARGEAGDVGVPLMVTRASGRSPLLVLVTPLSPPAFSIWQASDDVAGVLVQIADPAAPTRTQAEALRRAAGLTAAEARVAALVGAGSTVPEAAKALGISALTVKSQLHRCYDKTGVRSQVGLARLLASLPQAPRAAP